MPAMSDEADIQWGGLKEDFEETSVQLYSSFFSEGVEYKLYENVEVYNHTEEPYIGKIVKLWEEKSTREKKVLIQWFFKNKELKENPDGNPKEVFLAFGKGRGVTNVNELEVICGKCNILCTSKDARNKQPSPDDLKSADFFFSKVYNVDVQHFTPIEKVVQELGYDVVYNKEEWLMSSTASCGMPKVTSNANNDSVTENAIQYSRKRPRDSEVSTIQGKGKKFELGHEKPNASLAQAKRSDVNKENERASSSLGIDKDVDGEPLSVDKASSPVEGVSMSQATLLPGRNMVEEKCENQKLEFQSRNEKSVDDLQQSTLNDSNKKRVVKVDGTSGSSTRVMGHFQSDKKLEHGKHNKLKEPSLKKTREEMVQAIPDSEVGKKIQKCEPDKISERWNIMKDLKWEDRLDQGIRFGKVLLLQNFDPQVTSEDVRELLKSIFQGIIDAEVLPHERNFPYGQALAIFKTRSFADAALLEIEEGCLVITDQRRNRPIIANKVKEPAKLTYFPGHIPFDKLKLNRSGQGEEYKKAICTSHCSQPNTLEYEMAMEWRQLQEIMRLSQYDLFMKQRMEIEDLKRHSNVRS